MQTLLGELSEGTALALLATVVVTFVLLAWASTRRRVRIGALLRLWLREAETRPPGVRRYQQRLDEATFAIHHPWMKEGQRLDDILVPMHLDATAGEHRDGGPIDARNLLATLLSAPSPERPAPRVVVLGPPGSGKSVALRITSTARSLTLTALPVGSSHRGP